MGFEPAMDIRREDLDAAVAAGILDARARERLLAFVSARAEGAAGPDNESFRLLTGFNDIFVSLACLLLLGALAGLLPGISAPIGVAAASWALAEYFTARRRMALPSILLLLAFVGAVFAVMFLALGTTAHFARAVQQSMQTGINAAMFAPVAIAATAAAGAAALHWRRFRVPITLAAGAAAAAILFVSLIGSLSLGETSLLVALLLAGIGVFALAMHYDMRDRQRLTRDTDIAFWLHLLAAPMLVHPVFQLTGLADAGSSPAATALVLLLYLGLTLVALAIDRRALLVSALAYVLFALQGLFAAGQVATGFALTAFLLGSFLLMLSAAWGSLRRRLLASLPAPLAARLPAPA
jgi:hypothetical protein